MARYRKGDDPRFGGTPLVFGDTPSFACNPLVGDAGYDLFMGNPPGTTTGPSQQTYAVTGAFFGASQSAVQQQIDALSALAGLTWKFGYPTGIRFPDDFRWTPRPAYFLPADFVPSAITSAPGNTYQATYRLVMRVCPNCV